MVVVNTTVLSNLARVGRLSLLLELFGEVLIPLPVYAEVLRGLEAGYAFLEAVEELLEEEGVTLASVSEEERPLFRDLQERVDPAEAAGIALAHRRQLLFLSDDRVARRVAQDHGVAISGTLGLLKLAVDEGRLTRKEAQEILDALIAGGYRAPFRSIEALWEDEEGDEAEEKQQKKRKPTGRSGS